MIFISEHSRALAELNEQTLIRRITEYRDIYNREGSTKEDVKNAANEAIKAMADYLQFLDADGKYTPVIKVH